MNSGANGADIPAHVRNSFQFVIPVPLHRAAPLFGPEGNDAGPAGTGTPNFCIRIRGRTFRERSSPFSKAHTPPCGSTPSSIRMEAVCNMCLSYPAPSCLPWTFGSPHSIRPAQAWR
jgi:hypothetical protein